MGRGVAGIGLLALVLGHAPVAARVNGPSPATPAPVPSTRFELTSLGEIVVTARLNGGRTARLLLDTGSSHSVVSDRLVQALDLPVVAQAMVSSIAGDALSHVVRLDRFELGAIDARAVLPSVVPDDALDPTGRIEGVIGQDVLASERYTIDYDRREIVWQAGPAAPSNHRASFELTPDGGRFVIDVPQSHGVLRLVPDTGAETLVLFSGSSPTLPLDGLSERRLTSLVGSTGVSEGRLLSLQVGPFSLTDLPVALVTATTERHRTADGLLPLRLFKRAAFNGPARQLIVERH